MVFISGDNIIEAAIKGTLRHFHEWMGKYKIATIAVNKGEIGYTYCGDKRRRNKVYSFDEMFKEYKKDATKAN